MPSFLPRTLSGKKRESAKAVQSSGNPAPSSPSRFRVLSRSSSRPASSSSAVEGGNPANRGVLSRTPTATANSGRGGRAGVNGSGPSVTVDPLQSGGGVPGQTLSSPSPRSNQPQSPLNNVAGASAVNNQGSDRLVSSRNSNPGLLPNQGRGSSLQGNNPQQPPQRGLSEANGYSSPLRNSPNLPPMPLQNSQQQLRRLTTSPPIRTARSPVQDGPYPSINEFQRPGPTLALDSTDLTNSNLGVDRYPHPHGAPRHGPFNLQRNGAASYQNRDRNLFRSQSMTSGAAASYAHNGMEGYADSVPPSPRSFKGPNISNGERRRYVNSHIVPDALERAHTPRGVTPDLHRNGNGQSNGIMVNAVPGERGGVGGMGMGTSMAGLDGLINTNMGPTNMAQRRGANIPPMPRIPNMYRPSAQSVRNQNHMHSINTYSQYPPAFRNGRPRTGPLQDIHGSQLPSQYYDFEISLQDPTDHPGRMQNPKSFQPPPRPKPIGNPQSPPQDRRELKTKIGTGTFTEGTQHNSTTAENFTLNRMCEEQSQPTIPTALPTPSLTPTPPSRSNSNEGRQNSDNESVTERSQKYQDQKMTVPDSTVRQFNPVWSKPSQPQGYLQSHHYQPSRPAHGTDAPPSPISAPATPVTVSSASSMHGNPINRPIARQIKLSAPIMPGPLQESSFTRDISLVMEECMMGHGSTSVMKRTGNWQHRVGCMLCGGFGNESGETSPDGQAAAGKLWLWMCSWCALRVCGGCRYRLGEEEEKIRTRRGRGNSLTVKVDLQALRSKILEKARMVEKPDTKFPYESGISNIMENVLDVQASEIQTVAAVAPKRTDVTSRVDLEKKEAQQYIRKETVTMLSKKEIERTGESAVETSAESVNDKANIPHSRTLSSAITAPVPVTSVGNNQTSSVVPTDKSIDPFATAESTSQTEIFGRGVDVSRVMPPRAVKHPSRTPSMTQSQKFETEAAQGRLEASTSTLIAAPKSTGLPTGAESSQDSKSTIVPSASKTSPTTIATISTTTVPPHVVASPNSPASVARKSVPSESVTEASETLQALISGLPIVYTTNAPGTSLSPPPRIDSLPQPKQQQEKQVSSNSSQLLSKATSTPAPPPPMTPSSPVVPLVLATSLPSPATPTVHPPASPPQHTVKRKPVAPNMQGAYTESDKFAFPPLSFDSELAYEVDNLFENRSCTAPVQTTLVEEQPMIPDGKAAKVKKAKKWYRGLFK